MVAVALKGLYQARWSDEILNETQRNLARQIGDHTASDRINALRQLLPEAMVTDYGDHLHGLTNDPKDRHVVATAIKSGATVIVTGNLRDFHPLPDGIKAMSPDGFLRSFLSQVDDLVECLEDVRMSWPKPPSYEHLLSKLDPFTPRFTNALRGAI